MVYTLLQKGLSTFFNNYKNKFILKIQIHRKIEQRFALILDPVTFEY